MLHIGKITFFEVCQTQFPSRGLILGNVIGSHYDLIIDWVSTDLIGIPISRNKEAEVVEKIFKCFILKN